ncbi:MAG: hypothetical protein O3C57_00140 [Verrucomicrobia bacterium]|nr:hypothetical protein [Verrucomicrobiota bacterium]
MPSFSENLKAHLGLYKKYRLGVKEDGLSRNGYKYPYILPEPLQRLNILETYRLEFWQKVDRPDAQKELNSQLPGFHQLDSTQAMCFNLFAPFTHDPASCDVLLKGLGREPQTVKSMLFDRMIDHAEMHSLDFCIELECSACLLFELKLAENQFDSVLNPTPGQAKRLREIYAPLLKGKVPGIYLQEHAFFQYDQILRNIALLDLARGDHLYILFPRGNESLLQKEHDIHAICSMFLKDHVSIVYLEDLVAGLQALSPAQSLRFQAHFEMFKEKYILR